MLPMSLKEKLTGRRLFICAMGMFFYASGVAFTKNCNLGISPIVSVAYALSLILPVSLGWCTSLCNVVFIIIQKALLKREYTPAIMVAQILMSIIFSLAIDGTALLWSFVQPAGFFYPLRILIFIFGCAVLGLGVFLIVQADFVVLPAEGVVNAVTKCSKIKFGTVKILFDGTMVLTTAILTLAFLHELKGIREGTILAVLLIGTFVKAIARAIGPGVGTFLKQETHQKV